jgi:hypothetical protein
MLERVTPQELRHLANLADMARRSYCATEPALARRVETVSAAFHLAERQERSEGRNPTPARTSQRRAGLVVTVSFRRPCW